MPEFLNIELMNWEDFIDLVLRTIFNLIVIIYLVRYLYYKATPRKDYLFTYILISQVIFFMIFLLENINVSMGFALGLFAIFGIIRYRTRQIPIREMTYLFVVIGISVINALANRKVSYAELVLTNITMIVLVHLLEKVFLLKHESRRIINYENVELIKPEKRVELIRDLEERSPERLKEWVAHVRTALPDVLDIRTVERPEDRHRYLSLEYSSGLSASSWVISDGTLRMLALTILAYIPDLEGILLIEEPENGIHPRAVETVLQSLSSVYGAQVLLATHSPVILSLATLAQVLCFARTAIGATDIVSGAEHPRLREWRHETDLGTLFASGVLG